MVNSSVLGSCVEVYCACVPCALRVCAGKGTEVTHVNTVHKGRIARILEQENRRSKYKNKRHTTE